MPRPPAHYPERLKYILTNTFRNRLKQKEVQFGALDENWVDEHRIFYHEFSFKDAIRVILEDRDGTYSGYVNITPNRKISGFSEVYLSPPKHMRMKNRAFVTCSLPYNRYGQKEVECVPFITPDSYMSVCMQASIWIALQHLSVLSGGNVKSRSLPDIQNLAKGHHFCDGVGLLFSHAERILKTSGSGAFLIDNRHGILGGRISEEMMERILYAYVESRLPVILGVDANKLPWWEDPREGETPRYHSIVCIGHTMKRGKVDGYIFHDESILPYQKLSSEELFEAWKVPKEKIRESGIVTLDLDEPIMQAVVGVPPSVTIPYEIAELVAMAITDSLQDQRLIPRTIAGLRPSLVTRDALETLFEGNPALLSARQKINLPSWIWIFGISSTRRQRMRGGGVGLIVLDARKNEVTDPRELTVFVMAKNYIYLINKENNRPEEYLIQDDILVPVT
jgi:hypothetical protein